MYVNFQVTSSSAKTAGAPKKMLSSDKKLLCLPPEMSCIHFEYTEYYFPDGIDYPSKHQSMFSLDQLNLSLILHEVSSVYLLSVICALGNHSFCIVLT